MLINSRDEVYNVIQQMTAIFRGIAYYGAGTLQLLQDKPSDPQYLLSPSNVVDGIFQYQGTSQKARHTVAVVAWQSYDTNGDVEYEYVEDHDAVAKYGIIKKDIKAIGCYSQGQAHRAGKWTLLQSKTLQRLFSSALRLKAASFCDLAWSLMLLILLRLERVVQVKSSNDNADHNRQQQWPDHFIGCCKQPEAVSDVVYWLG